ncbi:MAG: hypothetical protein KQ78_02068 [Candidatus Izimaplasma bacterium HR2]|nr:MAG: hypothetical protein KQ78_02068 [Candidatus Izimaplasma bacterium HR2]
MEEYMIVIWFVVIILAAVIEMNTMDLSSIWFSAGALFAFIFSLLDAGWIVQVIIFLVVSVSLLILVRPVVKKYLKTNVISTNSDRLVGKVAICTKEIKQGERGEVKIDGKFWLAVISGEEDVDVDEKVEVIAIEGVKLIVDKI